MNLPNPYSNWPIEQSQNSHSHPSLPSYIHSYELYGQIQDNFYDHYEHHNSLPSPTFRTGEQPCDEDDCRSENLSRNKPFSFQVSGIHEKYLSTTVAPLQRQSFRSQKKAKNTKRCVTKFKKHENMEMTPPPKDLNPIQAGLSALQVESDPLKEQIRSKSSSQQQKGELFSQLGLKQPKVLGKAKTQRQLQTLINFLQTGELPQEYIAEFLVLISA